MTRRPSTISDRHAELLSVAMELVAERGYAGASLREIARRLGISQPSLYHYFSSKDELIEQIMRQHIGDRTLAFRAAIPAGLPLEEVLSRAVRLLIAMHSHHDQLVFARFLQAVVFERPELGELARYHLRDHTIAQGEALLAPLVASGELRARDVRNLTHLVIASLADRLIVERVLFGESPSPGEIEEFADFLIDITLRGLRRPGDDEHPAEAGEGEAP